MLSHLLAVMVELGGLSLFLSGFFLPEVRRKSDFAWSGVALIYALALWVEGDSTPGGALLGHIASVSLILWFGWQALTQRRQFAPLEDQTAIPDSLETLMPFLKEGWAQIMVSYGETSAWVQNQLAKEDSGTTLPEIQTPSVPLQDATDEDWENSENASSSLQAETPEATPTEPAEVTEAIATHPESATHPEPTVSEVPIEILPTAETLASEPDIELDPAQQPEIAPDSVLTPAETEEIQAPVVPEEKADLDLEPPATLTVTESPTTVENHDDAPQTDGAAETASASGIEQDNSHAEEAEEKISLSTPEDDDESWPPKDLT